MARSRAFRLAMILRMALQIFLQETSAQSNQGLTREEHSSDSQFFFFQQSEYPRDCQEVLGQCSSTISSGVYFIKPDGFPDPFEVYCEHTEDKKGWTVIERRQFNGSVDFDRSWVEYKDGFGFLSHELWIGNKRLSYLTNQALYQLVIEVTIADGRTFNKTYNNFRIGDEFSGYRLLGADYNPGAFDPFSWCPSNMVFGNCSCGQRRCSHPTICVETCAGDLTEGCICPEGYYMQGEECVPEEQCGCYLSEEHRLLTENETYINDLCSRKVSCADGELVRDDTYGCSSNAICAERDGKRKCYGNDGYTGDGETCTYSVRSDCQDYYNAGATSDGVYQIRPTNWQGDPFTVYCNMTTDGHGWTVFQRRSDGSVNFDRGWNDYTQGFGSVDHEHWLGNEKLHYLTNQRNYELRVDMVYKNGNPYFAKYASFRINDEDHNFQLTSLGTQSGNSGYNGFYGALNRYFSTKDRDNDAWSNNCASNYYRGGWWFGYYYCCYCGYSSLNGIYTTSDCSGTSIVWYYYYCSYYNLKYTEMKIRPI